MEIRIGLFTSRTALLLLFAVSIQSPSLSVKLFSLLFSPLPCLLQAWADAFRSSPDLTGVVQIYEELKRKGIEFPMSELETLSPIHTPQRVGGVVPSRAAFGEFPSFCLFPPLAFKKHHTGPTTAQL